MKCQRCNQNIVLHDNVLPNKPNKQLTMEDVTMNGMIYTQNGLRKYSDNTVCEVCNDSDGLTYKQLKSYRLRITK